MWQDLSVSTKIFYSVTLIFEFGLFFEIFDLAYNFSSMSARVFIIHMNIPCDKIFYINTKPFDLDFWHYFWNNKQKSWKIINIRASILQMRLFCTGIKVFVLVNFGSLELAIIRGICVSQTHLVAFKTFSQRSSA